MDEIQMEVSQYDRARKLVLYCNRGQKSRKIVSDLRQVGHQNCYSLKGGACSL